MTLTKTAPIIGAVFGFSLINKNKRSLIFVNIFCLDKFIHSPVLAAFLSLDYHGSNETEAHYLFYCRASGYTPAFALHAFDTKGRHTGPVPLPNPPPKEWVGIKERIPAASYSTAGYNVHLSFSNSEDQYQIEVRGRDIGNFTLDIQLFDSNSKNIATLEYAGGMVNPNYHAYLTIPPRGFTIPPELVVDSGGDGRPDARHKATILPVQL